MKYLKRFNENVSILDPEWIKFMPESLTIVTDNGEFELTRDNNLNNVKYPDQIYNLMTSVSIPYGQNTMDENGDDPLADGEPDTLQFDIYMVKNNRGYSSNPDLLRFNIDLTYGNAMQYEFTVDKQENDVTRVDCHHYTGKNSIYDPETYWGFTKESIDKLVEFFNRFGFNTTPEHFKFMDSNEDNYKYDKPIVKTKEIPKMIGADVKDVVDLKGGDKILRYEDMDDYKIDLDPDKK